MNADSDWKKEPRIQVNPSWIIQGLIAIILALGGWTLNETLNHIEENISDIKQDQQRNDIDIAHFRADLSALEIGLRGDRFTRTDWSKAEERINEEFDEIRERIRALESQTGND